MTLMTKPAVGESNEPIKFLKVEIIAGEVAESLSGSGICAT
jgi:hypothetical protein